ncbi:glycosyl hydrolase family 16 protein [Colletotrichum musicola]|uniref:Glycosyl hydrolase family 16 protein n=1 Tax=Colletotrichum musicola TaxID=2175873 RepID=A0A8H6IYG8_9PEZI|nr:glycosyl hydrolase family 16 protein [Colletotrichum musicola]
MRYAAFTLAAVGLASAQTWSLCNPVKGATCPANPAFGGEANYDFRGAKSIGDLESFFIVDDGIKYNPKVMSFSEDTGAQMTIFEEANAPTLTSKNYIFFGKVEVELQAAPGRGIVTSIVLQSDALDEIDWEFVGADQTHVQTNFYALGINDYTRARYYEVPFNPMYSFNTYTIEWTKESIIFSIDGKEYRTATPAEGNYPQTPMQLKLGTWVGGKGPNQGTIDWAGGLAEWDKAPFAGFYRSVKVWDYAGGDKAGAVSYEYNQGSDGTWQSIRVNGAGQQPNINPAVADSGDSHQPVQRETVVRAPATAAAATNPAPVVSSPATVSLIRSVISSARGVVNTTATAASNGTTMTRQTGSATLTGTADIQTAPPTPTSPSQPPAQATAGASSLQGGIFVAGLAAFFAAMML